MSALVLAMILLGLITFFYRFSFISAPGRRIAEKIPDKFLLLLAPTAFSAIIANNIIAHQASPEELRQKAVVAAISLVVAYFSRSMLVTVLFGLVLLFTLQNWPI